MERFNNYLKLLQGDTKGDLVLPLGGFNPMAKAHVLEQLLYLKELGIETVISEILERVNSETELKDGTGTFEVAFNLSDDLMGGWTNRYTADYQGRFKLNPLIKRNFCVPVFWTSELIDADKIKMRTLESCYRTLYFSSHPLPKTLKEHLSQEVFVASYTDYEFERTEHYEELHGIYELNKNTEDELFIQNFLYGDASALALGNQPIGVKEEFGGFRFVRYLVENGIQI